MVKCQGPADASSPIETTHNARPSMGYPRRFIRRHSTAICVAGLDSFTQAVLANVSRTLQGAASPPAACADEQDCFLQRWSSVRTHIPYMRIC